MAKKRTEAPSEWLKFKPRKGSVLAKLHEGPPAQVNVEGGTQHIYAGQYLVQVGELERTRTIPPKDGRPGSTEVTREPRLVVMTAEAFLAEFEPA